MHRLIQLPAEPLALCPLVDSVAMVTIDGEIYRDGALHAMSGAMNATTACADSSGTGLYVASDAGFVYFQSEGGPLERWVHLPAGSWCEDIIAHPAGGCLVAQGKRMTRLSAQGHTLGEWTHAQTITGLALDPKGSRVAASHFGGVSVSWLADPRAATNSFAWPGIHRAVSWSPCGKFLVSSLQDNALHGWRIADKTNMRMAGYPSRTKSMAWTADGKYLATSGAPAVVCWPFATKDGPMGKTPLELDADTDALCTAVACAAPDLVAAGYSDGQVVVFRLSDQAAAPLVDATGAPVAALAFARDGRQLAYARADGSAGVADFSA